ncbi:MAG TPA: zinc metalloprotease HtpX [Kouleothrix sp.]|uniref:zinc metalloprotease HtpX n=1 Tax=Kouleothrix sp. TaxID=2779161 RepID=UPI002C70A62C|nr:zinc metalloprotease HtpX [Kouleothrix sp.]
MGKNILKLTALLTALTVLFMLIGRAVGGTGGMLLAGVLAAAMNLGAYWFSDTLVLKMSGARPADPGEAAWLHEMVARLAQRAGLPMPKVYIIDSETPNAFATGRSPSQGVVAVTSGITRILTRDELAGVVAHELAHIKHRDTLISAVVATFAGAIAMIANIGQWALIFGGFGGDDEDEGGGGVLGGLLLLIVAPIAATLIQLGISRAREFEADAGGARILGDPLPLASALEKLEWAAGRVPMPASPATASLYIVNPLSGGGVLKLFSTHPPTAERVARLRALASGGLRQTLELRA